MSDLIDRQTAIDAILAVTGNSSVRELYEHVQEHGLSNMWSGGVNAAIDTIIAVPSAEPERKNGKWIERNPKEAAKVKADGEAESLRIRAEAEAEANDMIAKSLTPELIESQKIEKWDGKLPSIQGSAGTIIDFKGGDE